MSKSKAVRRCQCSKPCESYLSGEDKWCDTVVHDIYRNSKLEDLPKGILIQMIHSLEDKLQQNKEMDYKDLMTMVENSLEDNKKEVE